MLSSVAWNNKVIVEIFGQEYATEQNEYYRNTRCTIL